MERAVEQVRLLRNLSPATQMVMAMAIDHVDAAYSYSGNAQTDPLAELYKPYHNGLHTRYVSADTLRACDVLGITGFGREVAAVTAANHDTAHELDAEGDLNEQQSVVIMHGFMDAQKDAFTDVAYDYSRLALLGTFVDKAGYMLLQRATQQDYPSKLAEGVAHAVAAGDLGRLFTPDGPYLAHKYHQEKTTGASGIKPKIDTVLAFQESQALLLHGNYHYPRPELDTAFMKGREAVCRYNEELVKDLQAGNIDSWDALLQRDLQFMQQNS